MSEIIPTREVHDELEARKKAPLADTTFPITPCCRLWLLRILNRFHVVENLFSCGTGYREEELAEELGLPQPRDGEKEVQFRWRVQCHLRALLKEAEQDEQMIRLRRPWDAIWNTSPPSSRSMKPSACSSPSPCSVSRTNGSMKSVGG